MLINNVDIKNYVESFNQYHLHTVLQFLEVFGWSSEGEVWLREYLSSESLPPVDQSPPIPRRGVMRSGTVTGTCSCGGKIVSYDMPRCETSKTGRLVYEECNRCIHYSETFVGAIEEESEGG